jgi:hypothetical protein
LDRNELRSPRGNAVARIRSFSLRHDRVINDTTATPEMDPSQQVAVSDCVKQLDEFDPFEGSRDEADDRWLHPAVGVRKREATEVSVASVFIPNVPIHPE